MAINYDEIWEEGRLLGYPECCIQEFIDGFAVKERGASKKDTFSGTGYKPCAICQDEKSEKELIEIINTNRKLEQSFPVYQKGLALLPQVLQNDVLNHLKGIVHEKYATELSDYTQKFNCEKTALTHMLSHLYELGDVY